MRILVGAKPIHESLKTLIPKAATIEGAVAWASVGFDAFDLLLKHRSKIRRLVVGLHFHQTHPDFIQSFCAEKTVRFLMSSDGTFHPKAYYFELPNGEWKCIIGSANFTRSATENNQEIAVLVESRDPGADQIKGQVLTAFDEWWRKGRQFGPDDLRFYRLEWQKSRVRLARLAGTFGKWVGSQFHPDGGAAPIDIPIVRMDWDEFLQRVKGERRRARQNSLDIRLSVVQGVRRLFQKYGHFQDMPREDRYKVAGLSSKGDIDFGWFGSMKGAGKFKGAVKANDQRLSRALDRIPLQGEVSREDYMSFVAGFRRALPAGGHGVATATRLLAMKRPDLFVCLDNKNRQQLCKSFKIRQNVDYESYWDSIVERIQEAIWWGVGRPERGIERDIWEARAAFLDALFYKG